MPVPHRLLTCAAVLALALSSAARAVDAARPEASALTPQAKAERETWRRKLLQAPRKRGACFTAKFPETTWREVPCTAPPKHLLGPPTLMPPRKPGSPHSLTVGGGTDFVAQPPSPIVSAEGSFDAVSGANDVKTINAGAGGTNGDNLWTLQLNSDFFPTSLCKTLGSTCQGFAQYAYDNQTQTAYVQYWLVNLTGSCPSGWTSAVGDCVQTAPASSAFSSKPGATDLANMKVQGSSAGVTVFWNDTMISAPDNAIIPDLAANWGDAEFNIFGDGGGGEAQFNANTTVTVRTQVDTNANVLPTCVTDGWTAETNNLTLSSTPTMQIRDTFPSIIFDESNAAGLQPASCSTSLGDTHITTFDGLYYDFQASGEFVVADAGSDFVVQARQESGQQAFNNPHVTVNTAVAVKMGTARVVITDKPEGVEIDGKATAIADKGRLELPGGVSVLRAGASYAVTRASGELVRADLFNGWMNITVGLGHRGRNHATGLLASPTGAALALRDGSRLAEPFSANDLYQRYAKSWVVKPQESLFTEHPVAFAAPAQLISSRDLDPAAAEAARRACRDAGVLDLEHVESCVLDRVVLKDAAAIRGFAHLLPRTFVFKPLELRR